VSLTVPSSYEQWMRRALADARLAFDTGDVPVAALVIDEDGEVIGTGRNERELRHDPTAHAEVLALQGAASYRKSWRLEDCSLYVTLEPCLMCVGAILQARISRLIFGCLDPKAGAVESLYRLCEDSRLNHTLPVTRGVMESECGAILTEFFADLRKKKSISGQQSAC